MTQKSGQQTASGLLPEKTLYPYPHHHVCAALSLALGLTFAAGVNAQQTVVPASVAAVSAASVASTTAPIDVPASNSPVSSTLTAASAENTAANVAPETVDANKKASSRTAELFKRANERLAERGINSSGTAKEGRSSAPMLASLSKGELGARQHGVASWYHNSLQGNLTANGERYDRFEMTAAHQTLPLGTWVKVTRVGSQRSVLVRVNDRGPFVKQRIIDLSYKAASMLGIVKSGTARVVMEVVAGPDGESPDKVLSASSD